MPRSRLAGTDPSAHGRSRLRKEGVKHGRAASLLLVPTSFAPNPAPLAVIRPARTRRKKRAVATSPERVPRMLRGGFFFILFDFTFYYSCSKEGKRPSPRPKVSRTPASLFHRGLSGAKGSNKVCRPCEASPPVAQPEECQYTDTQRVNVGAASLFGHLCRMVPDCARPLTFPSRCPEEPRAPIVTVEFHFGGTDAQDSSACAGRLEKIGLEVGNEMNLRHRQVRPLC